MINRRVLLRWNSSATKAPGQFIPPLRPSPLPLGDSKKQREMEQLIKEQQQLAEQDPSGRHKDAEKERAVPFENDINPETGEIGGPRGPEPTRYGDWQTKGRVYDF